METNVPPTATLAVWPKRDMLNYLSRRVNPTAYPVWLPPQMEAFGQSAITAAFEKDSPDYVLIIAQGGSEFGVSFFGYESRYGGDFE